MYGSVLEEIRCQFSRASSSSVDSVCDPAVTELLIKLQRSVSEMQLVP